MSADFPEHWQLKSIEEVMDALIDYRGKTPKKTASGIPLITAKIVKSGRIHEPSEFIAEDNYDSWMVRGLPEVGDVVVTTEAPLGEVAQIKNSNIALAQRIVTLRGKKGLLNNDFLLYAMQSGFIQHQLESRASGSTVKGIKQSELRNVLVPIPPENEQIEIAKHLKSIDSKIDLNRQINQTHESMAQAIFKNWFVDFDPVKAKIAALKAGEDAEGVTRAAMRAISGKTDDELDKMEGGQPENYAKLKTTAELFPAVMQDSELGKVPEGWRVSNFGEVSTCFDKNRIPLSKRQREQKQGLIPYYGATSVMDFVDKHIFDGIYLLIGEDGSVLKDDGTPFIQYIGGKSWVNNHAHVLQGANGVSTEHLMLFIQSQNITAYVTGAVQLKLNQKNMNSIPFINAGKPINDAFYSSIAPLYAHKRNAEEEIKELSNLRDILLPKLLSGELEINVTNKAES